METKIKKRAPSCNNLTHSPSPFTPYKQDRVRGGELLDDEVPSMTGCTQKEERKESKVLPFISITVAAMGLIGFPVDLKFWIINNHWLILVCFSKSNSTNNNGNGNKNPLLSVHRFNTIKGRTSLSVLSWVAVRIILTNEVLINGLYFFLNGPTGTLATWISVKRWLWLATLWKWSAINTN